MVGAWHSRFEVIRKLAEAVDPLEIDEFHHAVGDETGKRTPATPLVRGARSTERRSGTAAWARCVSERLPRITAADLLRALQRDGRTIGRHKGGHAQLKYPIKAGRVTVATHARVILNPKTLSTALEQAGLTVADLRRLL